MTSRNLYKIKDGGFLQGCLRIRYDIASYIYICICLIYTPSVADLLDAVLGALCEVAWSS